MLLHKEDLVSLHKKCSLLKNIMKGDQMHLLDINQHNIATCSHKLIE